MTAGCDVQVERGSLASITFFIQDMTDLSGRVGSLSELTPFSTFQKFPGNPILDLGNTGDWDEAAAMYPSMIMAEDKFYIYYWGWNSNQTQVNGSRIGIAVTPKW
jgi:hypothetical protein